MGSLSDEDEPFLDRSGNSIIGWKENKANWKDVEVKKPVDFDEGRVVKSFEKGR